MYDFVEMLAAVPSKRVQHTLGTRDTALMLAARHFPDLDKNAVEAAAILHDVTKALTFEEHKELCAKYGVVLEKSVLSAPRVYHQITGALVAKHKFNLTDEAVNAIRYHTTGRANMSPLELVLLFADYIEPYRKYDGCDLLRDNYEQLYAANDEFALEKAIVKAFSMTIIEIIDKEEFIHPDIIFARNDLITKISYSKIEKERLY